MYETINKCTPVYLHEMFSPSKSRAIASMYSWGGGGGQKFPNDEKHFMAYEATKVFAIRKMKTQFTNKNTRILRTDIRVACSAVGSYF